MFGQNQGFAGMSGNSSFGGHTAPKENDFLQNMLRNQNRGGITAGGSQVHDGKLDLADPSILQARIQHHQQQQSSGAGQGVYGGQVPGGYNPGVMYGNFGGGRW